MHWSQEVELTTASPGYIDIYVYALIYIGNCCFYIAANL